MNALLVAIRYALPFTNYRLAERLATAASVMTLCVISTQAAVAQTPAYHVDTSADPGPVGTLSLRQAVVAAGANSAANEFIEFDQSLSGKTITLLQGELLIENKASLTINGPGADKLTISGNHASPIFYITRARVVINDLTLSSGASTSCGGAVFVIDDDLLMPDTFVTVNKSTISGNSTLNSGGGICAENSYLTVRDTNIVGNTASRYGGGIYTNGGELHLLYTSITHNSIPPPTVPALQGGGGIALFQSTYFSARNSTIAANYAYTGGGGVRLRDVQSGGATRLDCVTIASNTTGDYSSGNGIMGISSAEGIPKIRNSIVANNSSRGLGNDDLSGYFEVNASLIGALNDNAGGLTGSGNKIGVNPMLGTLGDHGGLTTTMLPEVGSPALNSAALDSYAMDQRYYSRISPAGADMGAVERQFPEDIIFRNGFSSL